MRKKIKEQHQRGTKDKTLIMYELDSVNVHQLLTLKTLGIQNRYTESACCLEILRCIVNF